MQPTNETERPLKPITIGVIAGGSRQTEWEGLLRELARDIGGRASTHPVALSVNVVFHIPGDIYTPPFVGARTGTFSRKSRKLMIQVALPTHPSLDGKRQVFEALAAAVALAEDFATQEAFISGRLEGARSILEGIEANL